MHGSSILQNNHWASSLLIMGLMFGWEMCVELAGAMGIYLYQRRIRYIICFFLYALLIHIMKFIERGVTPNSVEIVLFRIMIEAVDCS